MTIQGSSISLPSGSASFAAIDTGTTLIGGPPALIEQVFAQIPGSAPGTGDYESYYTYRSCFESIFPCQYVFLTYLFGYIACATDVSITLSFGGRTWDIEPADFLLMAVDGTTCIGAFFALENQGNAPAWIIGDTFLVRFFFPILHIFDDACFRKTSILFSNIILLQLGLHLFLQ